MTEQWRFAQCFGEKEENNEINEADLISTVEFDITGDYLATGDKGGRIVLFKKEASNKVEYQFYNEFQSHEPEFDYLKSLEIEEKINKIKWLPQTHLNSKFLISTNDKTIKLWKTYDKNSRTVLETNLVKSLLPSDIDSTDKLKLPITSNKESSSSTTTSLKKTYSNAHAYHINSIAMNADHETFLSADDLRINLWNIEISDSSFNIVDIKPVNMEELTEVITAAETHPNNNSMFMYASSKGQIKLCDMRDQALCDTPAIVFEEEEDPQTRSFFSEIISSVSDIKFSKNNNDHLIITRDYLSCRVWDIRNNKKPVFSHVVHDHLRPKLCDLYENDCIFDKFEVLLSPNSENIIAGTYNNYLNCVNIKSNEESWIQAKKSLVKNSIVTSPSKTQQNNMKHKNQQIDKMFSQINYNNKILHASYHPTENIIAIAATNNLFIFNSPSSSISSTNS